MSTIKTITAALIARVLADDFHTSYLLADSERRSELAKVEPDDVRELINRLDEALPVIEQVRSERRTEALEALKAALPDGFNSVEELIAAATGGHAPVQATSERKQGSKSSDSNNKIFTIELYDTVSGKTFTGRSTNKKITFSDKEGKEAYEALLQKDPAMEDHDTFMRKYSSEYQQAYPLNAKYGNEEFHINARGKLNASAMKYFEKFKAKDKSGLDEKELLQKFKESVAI